jgi:hypothetical protein
MRWLRARVRALRPARATVGWVQRLAVGLDLPAGLRRAPLTRADARAVLRSCGYRLSRRDGRFADEYLGDPTA